MAIQHNIATQTLSSTWKKKYHTAVGAVALPALVKQWAVLLRRLPLDCSICPSLAP